MEMAVDLARKCASEKSSAVPKVGAVLVCGDTVVTAYRGERNPGDHAEYTLETKTQNDVLGTAELYTTLEPCTTRNHPKVPCAKRICDRHSIRRVYVGMLDPNPEIRGRGYQMLLDANIDVVLFDPDLQRSLLDLNRDFSRRIARQVSRKKKRTQALLAVPALIVVVAMLFGSRPLERWWRSPTLEYQVASKDEHVVGDQFIYDLGVSIRCARGHGVLERVLLTPELWDVLPANHQGSAAPFQLLLSPVVEGPLSVTAELRPTQETHLTAHSGMVFLVSFVSKKPLESLPLVILVDIASDPFEKGSRDSYRYQAHVDVDYSKRERQEGKYDLLW